MTTSAAQHWWGCIDAVLERITESLPFTWRAEHCRSLDDVLDHPATGEASRIVFLIPLGPVGFTSAAGGRVAHGRQRWAVVFALRHLGDVTGDGLRDAAGPVIPAVLSGLMGWSPGHGWGPLALSEGPVGEAYGGEFAFYQFTLESVIELKATR